MKSRMHVRNLRTTVWHTQQISLINAAHANFRPLLWQIEHRVRRGELREEERDLVIVNCANWETQECIKRISTAT